MKSASSASTELTLAERFRGPCKHPQGYRTYLHGYGKRVPFGPFKCEACKRVIDTGEPRIGLCVQED